MKRLPPPNSVDSDGTLRARLQEAVQMKDRGAEALATADLAEEAVACRHSSASRLAQEALELAYRAPNLSKPARARLILRVLRTWVRAGRGSADKIDPSTYWFFRT